jgi:hypothetical protein
MKRLNTRTVLLSIGVFACTTAWAADGQKAATPEAPTYTLRDLVVGSVIPKDIVSSPVPFDRRYEQLTPEQRDVLRSDYEALGATDETPFPANGLKQLVTPMMRLAERSSISGKFVAGVEVGPDGRPRSIDVFKSPDPAMTELARAQLAEAQYKPASCKGQPCVMTYVLRLEFLQR